MVKRVQMEHDAKRDDARGDVRVATIYIHNESIMSRCGALRSQSPVIYQTKISSRDAAIETAVADAVCDSTLVLCFTAYM